MRRILLLSSLIQLCQADWPWYSSLSSHAAIDAMFKSDAETILNHLSYFDKLYVSFYNCALAPYDGGDGDGGECGAQVDDQYWYMGSTECFRASAAYALYGVLKGEEDPGCARGTYINSFFTNAGVEAFTQSLYAAGISFTNNNNNEEGENEYPGGVSSQCIANENERGRFLQDEENGNNHNQKYSGNGVTSMGLGCNQKKFALKTYGGAYCDINDEQGISNYLEAFNEDMEEAKCVVIYSAADNNNEEGGGEGGNKALSMLEYSQACSIRDFPSECPDPYGKLMKVAQAEIRADRNEDKPNKQKIIRAVSWALLALGLLFIALALFVYHRRSRLPRLRAAWKAERNRSSSNGRNWGNFFKNRSKSSSSSNNRNATKTTANNREVNEASREIKTKGYEAPKNETTKSAKKAKKDGESSSRKSKNKVKKFFSRGGGRHTNGNVDGGGDQNV